MPVKKRRNYNDEFRASAVVMLEAGGYPDNPYKLEEIARYLRIPARTLRRWYLGDNNPPPDKLVSQQKEALTIILERVVRDYLAHALKADVIEETSGNAAITAAAIALDKMRLIQGEATERVEYTDAERSAEIIALLDRARAREAGQSSNNILQ